MHLPAEPGDSQSHPFKKKINFFRDESQQWEFLQQSPRGKGLGGHCPGQSFAPDVRTRGRWGQGHFWHRDFRTSEAALYRKALQHPIKGIRTSKRGGSARSFRREHNKGSGSGPPSAAMSFPTRPNEVITLNPLEIPPKASPVHSLNPPVYVILLLLGKGESKSGKRRSFGRSPELDTAR